MTAYRGRIRDITYIALATAVIAVSAQISIPLTVPVTLQTLAIFLAVTLLGTGRGTAAVGLYIFIGAIGIPVFSSFKGGLAVLLGATGGYIIGFIPMAVIAGIIIGDSQKRLRIILALSAGILVLYSFGTVFFILMWMRGGEQIGFYTVLAKCVLPFIPADAIKIWICTEITVRLKGKIKYLKG